MLILERPSDNIPRIRLRGPKRRRSVRLRYGDVADFTSASIRSPPRGPGPRGRSDIALPEEVFGCVRTYGDMVTLVQERVDTRQLAAD